MTQLLDAVILALRYERPGCDVEVCGNDVKVDGALCRLDDLRRHLTSFPATSHAAEIMRWAKRLGPIPTHINISQVMVRIRSDHDIVDRSGSVAEPFVNDTVLSFCVDAGTSIVSVSERLLEVSGLQKSEIERAAIANIEAMPIDVQCVPAGEGGMGAFVDNLDGYTSSRLLSRKLYESMAPRLGSQFYAGIPCRDMLVMFTMEPATLVARMHARIKQDYRLRPYPITDRLFVVTRDGVAGTEPDGQEDGR